MFTAYFQVGSRRVQGMIVILSYQTYTANIFNVSFTIFMCVPLSTIISLFTFNYFSKYSGKPKKVNTDLQWFIVIFTILVKYIARMHMANTCNFYTFLRVSQFPLYIFAVHLK